MTYNPHLTKSMQYGVSKLFFESYLSLLIVLILNVLAFKLDDPNFGAFWQTTGDIINSFLVLIFFPVSILFPVWILVVLVQNYRNGTMADLKEKHEFLLEDSKTNNLGQSLYSFFFILRRFIMAVVLTLMTDWPYG